MRSTGAVRTAFDESVATYYRSGIDAVSWRYLARLRRGDLV